MTRDVRVPSVNYLMCLEARVIVESCEARNENVNDINKSSCQQQTFIAHNTDEVLLLRVSQHVFFQVLLLLERRLAPFMLAFERTIFAVNVFDVNFQLGPGGEGRRTLIAMVVLDLEVALQMFLDVLLLEGAQSANVALEPLLF